MLAVVGQDVDDLLVLGVDDAAVGVEVPLLMQRVGFVSQDDLELTFVLDEVQDASAGIIVKQ